MVLRISSGNPGHRGIPGTNSCVRSTYFLPASVCWIGQSDSPPRQMLASKTNPIIAGFIKRLLTECAVRSQQLLRTHNRKGCHFGQMSLSASAPRLFTGKIVIINARMNDFADRLIRTMKVKKPLLFKRKYSISHANNSCRFTEFLIQTSPRNFRQNDARSGS